MKTKFGFLPYDPLDYKAAQDYLDRKAAQGWVLDSILLGGLVEFVPAGGRRHYVDVCSSNSLGPDYDFLQLCQDAGWEYITDRNDMVFFRSLPGVDPRPIQSDPAFEWREFVRKQVRRQFVFSIFYLLLLFAEPLISFSHWSQYTLTLLQTALTYPPFLLCIAALLPVWLWNLGHTTRYLSRCRAAGEMAPQPWFPGYLRSSLTYVLSIAFLILLCVVTALAFS